MCTVRLYPGHCIIQKGLSQTVSLFKSLLFASSGANYWQLWEWHTTKAFPSCSLISMRVGVLSLSSITHKMKPFLCLLSIYHQIFIWSVSSTLKYNNDLWLFEISFKAADKIQKLLDISVLEKITEPKVLVWCLVWNWLQMFIYTCINICGQFLPKYCYILMWIKCLDMKLTPKF